MLDPVEWLVLVLPNKALVACQRQLEAVIASTCPHMTRDTTIAWFSNRDVILGGKDGLSYLLETTSELIKER